MDKRDKELDELLSPLRRNQTDDLKLERWQRAVRVELTSSGAVKPRFFSQSVAAALIFGFLLGGLSMRLLSPSRQQNDSVAAEKSDPNATVEYIFAKSE